MTQWHGIGVVYEDNHVLVTLKPPNMPSQADRSGDADMLTLLKAYVGQKYNKPGAVWLGLVHRLDRPASGLMLFARTSKAAARLSDQMRRHAVQKTYLARLTACPPRSEAELVDWLYKGEDGMVRTVSPDMPGARQARLCYRLTEQGPRPLVRIVLHTGRSHQIRVQFASRGCALAGDARYGSGGRQLALFASELAFDHPTKKERMVFTQSPPQGLLDD